MSERVVRIQGSIDDPTRFSKLITDKHIEKFWNRVRYLADGCFIFIGAGNENNYGRFRVHPLVVYAHRFSYVSFFGDTDKVIHHKCNNRRCVNPAHLEAITQAENIELRDEVPF